MKTLFKTLAYLKCQNPKPSIPSPFLSQSPNPNSFSSILQKSASTSLQFDHSIDPEPKYTTKPERNNKNDKKKKPLAVFFKETLGLSPKTEDSEAEAESSELVFKLRQLRREIKRLEQKDEVLIDERGDSAGNNPGRRVSLYDVFTSNSINPGRPMRRLPEEGGVVLKELSGDAELLLRHLYEEGYFRNANFIRNEEGFDLRYFDDKYSRNFVKLAATEFGKDHQEVAKWLSGSDLKAIAAHGCPSLTRHAIFAAKSLRTFFKIQENAVCAKCAMRDSCKYANQSVWKSDKNSLRLSTVMRVITPYLMEFGPPQLPTNSELKAIVGKVLRDIIKLSPTVGRSEVSIGI